MDYGKQENPITEAWLKYTEWRYDFIKYLEGRYQLLVKRIVEEQMLKIGGTDPD